MRLAAAIRKTRRTTLRNGTVGKESPCWYEVTRLTVTSGGIDIADVGGVNDSFRLRVQNGLYAIEVKLIDFGGALRVSRIRARPDKTICELGRKCAEIPIDFAAIAIADIGAVRKTLDDDELEELADAARSLMNAEFCQKMAVAVGSRKLNLVVCQSGFGDGTYPAFLLKSKRRIVGFEMEFLRDGHVFHQRGNNALEDDGSFDQMTAQMEAQYPPAERPARRNFVLTGEQSVLLVIWQKKNAAMTEILQRWLSEGRRGLPDSTLSKLCRAGVVRRAPLAGERGSSYSLSNPKLKIWNFRLPDRGRESRRLT
jgi:hypothetical protein